MVAAAMAGSFALACAPVAASATERVERASPGMLTESFTASGLFGTLTLPGRGTGLRPPVVVLVHDANGPDPRGDRYVEQLAGAGIAALELLSDGVDSPTLLRAVEALAADPRTAGAGVGVLAFGAGAAVVAAARGPFAAAALLYPGCAGLASDGFAAAAGTPLLLMHGEADPANPPAACAAAAAALERDGAAVRRIAYAGAGYAWDYPAMGTEARSLVPSPGGPHRVFARPWPALATLSATQVAGFFDRAFKAASP